MIIYAAGALVLADIIVSNIGEKSSVSPQVQQKTSIGEVNGEFCTTVVNTYPRQTQDVYAVGQGRDQKIRKDTFVISANGRKPTQYYIVNSGVTYIWKPGENIGIKFSGGTVPFKEYLEEFQLFKFDCGKSKIDTNKFSVPGNIKWATEKR